MRNKTSFALRALVAVLLLSAPQVYALEVVPAVRSSHAVQAPMLGVAWAQERIVAVGDHGIVLLSDDQGRHFRQARSVPLSTPLTGVSFIDEKHGWAVGHWGVILASRDGGESWQIQRMSQDEDRPLFAVHFFNARQGVAVGLWSLVLTTEDGGETWHEQELAPPPGHRRADLNLMGLFADTHGRLYVAAEQGQVLHSDDRGRSWTYIDTGYEGSLWAGAVLADGSLLVGGQRGTLLHRSHVGQQWRRIPIESKSSITAIAVLGPQVVVAGLDGLVLRSLDSGRSFEEISTDDGVSLTAALLNGQNHTVLFSRRGVVPAQAE